MTDFLSTIEPGAYALPGDLLYLGEDVEGWDLPAGFYVLSGQVGGAIVLTPVAADAPDADDDADEADQIMVPCETLARMTTCGVGIEHPPRRRSESAHERDPFFD